MGQSRGFLPCPLAQGLGSHLSTKVPCSRSPVTVDWTVTLPPHGFPITTGSRGSSSSQQAPPEALIKATLSSFLTVLPYGVGQLASSHQPRHMAVGPQDKELQRGGWHRTVTESKMPGAGAAFCPGGRCHSYLVELVHIVEPRKA